MSRFMQGPWECPPSLEGCPKGQDTATGDGRPEPSGSAGSVPGGRPELPAVHCFGLPAGPLHCGLPAEPPVRALRTPPDWGSLAYSQPFGAPCGSATSSGLLAETPPDRGSPRTPPIRGALRTPTRCGDASVGPRPRLPAGGAATPRPPSSSSSDSNRSGGGRMAGGLSAPQARRGSGRAPAQARGPRRRSRCRCGGHGVRRARLFPSGGGRESRSAAAPGTLHPSRRPARRLPAHRRGLSPALPATSPGNAPGNRVPNFLDPQRPARSRPGLCGGRAGPHRGGSGPGTEEGRRWNPSRCPPSGSLRRFGRDRATPKAQRGPRAQLGAP